MLLNRVKIIALCAGGWVSVMAAYMSCNTLQLPVTDPRYHCKTVATNSTAVNSLASIQVNNTDPGWCPVIIEGVGNVKFQSYSSDVQLNTAVLDPARPRVLTTFANANNVTQKSVIFGFTNLNGVSYTTAVGDYTAGTAGNVTTKRDFAHTTIYTTLGPATGDVWLDYDYKANPTMSGATSQSNGHIVMTANTPRVQQPVSYQWWINGALQGPPSGYPDYYQQKTKDVSQPGTYTFKAVIIDHNNNSYTISRSVTVTAVCPTGKRC